MVAISTQLIGLRWNQALEEILSHGSTTSPVRSHEQDSSSIKGVLTTINSQWLLTYMRFPHGSTRTVHGRKLNLMTKQPQDLKCPICLQPESMFHILFECSHSANRDCRQKWQDRLNILMTSQLERAKDISQQHSNKLA
jgi:hypothetical protein